MMTKTHPDTHFRNIRKNGFMDKYSDMLRPFTLDRGISWEAEVLQTDPVLWRMDGFRPPTILERERLQDWAKAGKPIGSSRL